MCTTGIWNQNIEPLCILWERYSHWVTAFWHSRPNADTELHTLFLLAWNWNPGHELVLNAGQKNATLMYKQQDFWAVLSSSKFITYLATLPTSSCGTSMFCVTKTPSQQAMLQIQHCSLVLLFSGLYWLQVPVQSLFWKGPTPTSPYSIWGLWRQACLCSQRWRYNQPQFSSQTPLAFVNFAPVPSSQWYTSSTISDHWDSFSIFECRLYLATESTIL